MSDGGSALVSLGVMGLAGYCVVAIAWGGHENDLAIQKDIAQIPALITEQTSLRDRLQASEARIQKMLDETKPDQIKLTIKTLNDSCRVDFIEEYCDRTAPLTTLSSIVLNKAAFSQIESEARKPIDGPCPNGDAYNTYMCLTDKNKYASNWIAELDNLREKLERGNAYGNGQQPVPLPGS